MSRHKHILEAILAFILFSSVALLAWLILSKGGFYQIQDVQSLLTVYKYLALFGVAFISSLGVPVPAAWTTMTSSALATQGFFNIFGVMLAGVVGNILGDLSMYSLSKRYGKKVLIWIHLRKIAESEELQDVEKIQDHFSSVAIIASRFQDQTTAIVNVVAGLGNVNFKRFLKYIVIGNILQIGFYSGIGYFFAGSWQSIYDTIGIYSWFIIGTIIILSFFLASKFKMRMLR